MLVLLFLTIAMPNTTTPLHLLPNTQILPVFLHWIPTFNIHLCNKNGGGHQGTLDYTMTIWKTMLKRWSAIWLCCTVPLAPHHASLLPVTIPSFPSLSPPPHHCPLLPITVPLLPITVPSVLSFPSLSPPSSPSHHCPLRPLLPITVPSSPSLSPPSHHCPLLPITVPSSPSLSPPPHHIMLSWQIVFPTTLKIFSPPPNLVS